MCGFFLRMGALLGLLAGTCLARSVATEQDMCAAADAVPCRAPPSRSTVGLAMIQRPGHTLHRVALAALEEADQADAARLGVASEASVIVGSYNLYWWNVKQNNRWDALHSRIQDESPFDLIGFQECEDVDSTLQHSGLSTFDSFQGPSPNSCPLAWNTATFSRLGEPGSRQVGEDQWGERWMNWVRLQHRATGATVLFVNTHGPLNGCTDTLGNNWVDGVNENWHHGDVVFMTGDYNCGTGSTAMNLIKALLSNAVDGGIDQILTTGHVLSGGTLSGSPSDHPLVKGVFGIPSDGSSTAVQPVPQPTPAADQNHYRKVSGVGAWGGWCTCPDGQRYNVGDKWDACANGPSSLACEGGNPEGCAKEVDVERDGMMVTCAAAPSQFPAEPTTAPSVPDSQPSECAPFAEWPSMDGDVTCSSCTALVLTANFDGRCDKYCESFGHVCVAAAEETNEGCEELYTAECSQRIADTSDMLCTCHLPSSSSSEPTLAPSTPVPTTPAPSVPDSQTSTCAPFAEWPSLDDDVTCGGCTALVLIAAFDGRCDKYCESFGHVCVAAAEETGEGCEVKYAAECNQQISDTTDMLCTCHSPSP